MSFFGEFIKKKLYMNQMEDGERGRRVAKEFALEKESYQDVDMDEDLIGMAKVVFRHCNQTYFDNKLDNIHVRWSCTSREDPDPGGHEVEFINGQFKHTITLEKSFHCTAPLSEWRSTLIHELIHAYLWEVDEYNPSHGKLFCQLMKQINVDGRQHYGSNWEEIRVKGDPKYFIKRHTWKCAECQNTQDRRFNSWWSVGEHEKKCGGKWDQMGVKWIQSHCTSSELRQLEFNRFLEAYQCKACSKISVGAYPPHTHHTRCCGKFVKTDGLDLYSNYDRTTYRGEPFGRYVRRMDPEKENEKNCMMLRI